MIRLPAVSLAVALLSAAGSAWAAPRAELPTYAVGDKWIRNDGAYDLVRIEKGRYVFAAGPDREVHLTRDLVTTFARRGGRQIEFDPPPKLRWPLEVGRSGYARGYWTGPSSPSGSAPATFSWRVEAIEPVTMAGTTLETFRVLFGTTNERNQRLFETRAWYAPEVRQWVKSEGAFPLLDFSVVAFDQPVSAPLTVAVEAPANEARVSSPTLVLLGKAAGGKGVARVQVSVNGSELGLPKPPAAPQPELTFRVPVSLQEGRNVVLVTATERDGSTRQDARVVFFERPPPASPASGPGTTPPPPVDKPAVSAPTPLRLTLSSPKDRSRVEQEVLAVAGVASGGRGVARVLVTLNGVEAGRVAEPSPQPALAVNLPVKLSEGANTLVVTATDAGGAVHQEVRAVEFRRPVPLTVAFRYPEDKARLTEDASVIAAIVTSSKGVQRVRVTLNGTEVADQTERTPQPSVAVTLPITLRPGANAIAITAIETDGTTRQELRTVVYDAPKTAATAPPPAPSAPARNRWAVVIGVGRYESPEVPRLRYTVSDAEAIYQTLTGVAGFKKEHVLLLTDTAERKPTLRNVKWALGTFLGRSAQKDDTVVIFFAGHGAPEVDPRGLERDGLAKYLIPSDADPDDLYSTALPMDELQTIFQRIEAERVVAFLDACYSGAAGGRTFLSKKMRAGTVDDLFLERLTRSKGRAIITASRPSEVSIELPELGHGIFTYYLLQGLKGAGDLNRDGIVSLQELYEYVEQQVTQKSRAIGGNQHPVMKGELEGVLPLVKVGGR